MAPFPLLSTLLSLFLLQSRITWAQSTIEELSFGHKEPISPNNRGIPHFHLFGEPSPPQVLRDRVILTPPAVGHRRASIWAETKSTSQFFSASLWFRASGPLESRGGGNLQLWYTTNGHLTMGAASLFTTHNFDGLALLVSTSGGTAGQIRAFLNDGSTDYKSHHNIESLAFAHCDYSYRNLGVFSLLTLTQDHSSLKVTIDGKPCIETDKVRLPADNYFGVSAASAEVPDSFEVARFIVSAPKEGGSAPPPQGSVPQPGQEGTQQQQQQQQYLSNPHDTTGGSAAAPPSSNSPDLAALQSQLSSLTTQLNHLQGTLSQLSNVAGDRHAEVLRNSRVPHEQLNSMEQRLLTLERSVQRVRDDVEGKDYRGHIDELRHSIRESQNQLLEGLPRDMGHVIKGAAPRLGVFVLWVVGGQIGVFVAYVLWKRRGRGGVKKYL